jgi:hypothetical protein
MTLTGPAVPIAIQPMPADARTQDLWGSHGRQGLEAGASGRDGE